MVTPSPEAAHLVAADVVLQVSLRQHGAAGYLLGHAHKQTACDTNETCDLDCQRSLSSTCTSFKSRVLSRITSCADSCGADLRALQRETAEESFNQPPTLSVYRCTRVCTCVCVLRHLIRPLKNNLERSLQVLLQLGLRHALQAPRSKD